MSVRPRLLPRVYVDAAGEYRWRLVARNGRIVACSGEGFVRRRDCYRSLRLVWREARRG